MDERVLPAALVIGLLVVLLGLMYLGFRRRQRAQSDLPRPLPVPGDPGSRLAAADLLYVATTAADAPLERIAVAGLGFRARASVAVFERGVALGIAGEPDAFLPAEHITGVGRSTWTIDRVVETGGLLRIAWRLGDALVDSYLRAEPGDQAALIAAIDSIAAGIPDPSGIPDPNGIPDPSGTPEPNSVPEPARAPHRTAPHRTDDLTPTDEMSTDDDDSTDEKESR